MMRKLLLVLSCSFMSNTHGDCKAWSDYSAVLLPSPIEGLGVFVTHDVKAGSVVLSGMSTEIKVKASSIPDEFLKYCTDLEDGYCLRPTRFDCIELDWYVNHSFFPNIAVNPEGDFIALRDIKDGEELLLNYNYLQEPIECKDCYYIGDYTTTNSTR